MSLRIKSAQKKHRQSLKRRERNRFVMSTLKTKIKGYTDALESKDVEKSKDILKELVSLTAKASTKGVIHKRKASRRISRFSKKLDDLSRVHNPAS